MKFKKIYPIIISSLPIITCSAMSSCSSNKFTYDIDMQGKKYDESIVITPPSSGDMNVMSKEYYAAAIKDDYKILKNDILFSPFIDICYDYGIDPDKYTTENLKASITNLSFAQIDLGEKLSYPRYELTFNFGIKGDIIYETLPKANDGFTKKVLKIHIDQKVEIYKFSCIIWGARDKGYYYITKNSYIPRIYDQDWYCSYSRVLNITETTSFEKGSDEQKTTSVNTKWITNRNNNTWGIGDATRKFLSIIYFGKQ